MSGFCPPGWVKPPPAVVRANLAQLRTFVRRVDAAVATGALTSWYRDAVRNAACGGSPGSAHLRGLAIDVRPTRAEWLRSTVGFQRAGLRVLDEGDHLHVSL